MARCWLQHVHRHERRCAAQRRTLGQYVEPHFRRPPGQRQPYASRQPRDGRRCRARRPLRGHPQNQRPRRSGVTMEPFIKHTGLVAPLDRVNVDTDQMVPKQFLKFQTREGYGRVLFYDWRYLPGEKPNPDFVLNYPRYKGASVILAQANFGCGSSREHAPWAILDYGFRAILAPSYADIFYNNCFKNGILPVTLSNEQIDELFARTEKKEGYRVTVDLQEQVVTDDGGLRYSFEVDPFRRDCLLQGLDDIGLTLVHEPRISAFEATNLKHPAMYEAVDVKHHSDSPQSARHN